ncbi:MAG: archease [archaeon]
MSYEFLEHTADVKFRAEGLSVEEMFIEAARALNEIIYGDVKVLERVEKSFEVEGKDWESLLYNFLEEFLYLLDAENFLVGRIKEIEINGEENGTQMNADERGFVSGDKYKLKCVVVGDSADNYKFTNDVKAVTYSEMKVVEKDGKWICEVVLDV